MQSEWVGPVLFYIGGPSSMPAIKACSLKPVLENGAFKLASIPLELEFFTSLLYRCSQNIVEELQAPELRFLERSVTFWNRTREKCAILTG